MKYARMSTALLLMGPFLKSRLRHGVLRPAIACSRLRLNGGVEFKLDKVGTKSKINAWQKYIHI